MDVELVVERGQPVDPGVDALERVGEGPVVETAEDRTSDPSGAALGVVVMGPERTRRSDGAKRPVQGALNHQNRGGVPLWEIASGGNHVQRRI